MTELSIDALQVLPEEATAPDGYGCEWISVVLPHQRDGFRSPVGCGFPTTNQLARPRKATTMDRQVHVATSIRPTERRFIIHDELSIEGVELLLEEEPMLVGAGELRGVDDHRSIPHDNRKFVKVTERTP